VADNAQKTPLARTLNQFAARKALGIIELLGKALPASVVSIPTAGVPIVTIKFELTNIAYTLPQVTCPLFGPEYIRYPIQVGCKGVAFPADAYLGGMSGLGGGTADLTPRANLSTLVFFPIGNTAFAASEDANAMVIYGPDGTIIRNTAKSAVLKVTTAECSVTPPTGKPFIVNGNLVINGNLQFSGNIEAADGTLYTGNIHTAGAMIAGYGTGGQVGLQTHTHTQPDDSHGDVEGPTAAPTGGT